MKAVAFALAVAVTTISPAADALLLTNVSTYGGDAARHHRRSGGPLDDLWCYCKDGSCPADKVQRGKAKFLHFSHGSDSRGKCCKFTTFPRNPLKSFLTWTHHPATYDKEYGRYTANDHCKEEIETAKVTCCTNTEKMDYLGITEKGAMGVLVTKVHNRLTIAEDGSPVKQRYFDVADIAEEQYRARDVPVTLEYAKTLLATFKSANFDMFDGSFMECGTTAVENCPPIVPTTKKKCCCTKEGGRTGECMSVGQLEFPTALEYCGLPNLCVDLQCPQEDRKNRKSSQCGDCNKKCDPDGGGWDQRNEEDDRDQEKY